MSTALFRITEYEGPRASGPEALRPVYHSSRENPMCLRDASRYAAALSYARGAYVRVWSDTPGEYEEFWYAGQITRPENVPTIRGGAA
jgi:hypothetical protein